MKSLSEVLTHRAPQEENGRCNAKPLLHDTDGLHQLIRTQAKVLQKTVYITCLHTEHKHITTSSWHHRMSCDTWERVTPHSPRPAVITTLIATQNSRRHLPQTLVFEMRQNQPATHFIINHQTTQSSSWPQIKQNTSNYKNTSFMKIFSNISKCFQKSLRQHFYIFIEVNI